MHVIFKYFLFGRAIKSRLTFSVIHENNFELVHNVVGLLINAIDSQQIPTYIEPFETI